MKRILVLIVVAGLYSGCGKQPCDGVSGTCVAVTVNGSSGSRVDRLDVATVPATARSPQTSMSTPTSLPIRLAVVLPAEVTGMIELDVDGQLGTTWVGHGTASLNVTPGRHLSVSVTLVGGMNTGDDMAPDDAGIPDGGICAPDAPVACADASTLTVCSGDGRSTTTMPCALGCASTPMPHCQVFVPSAPLAASDFIGGLPATLINAGGVVQMNTDTGAITNLRAGDTPNVVSAGIGFRKVDPGTNFQGLGVFSFGSLEVAEGTTLQLVGTRGAVLVANSTIKITGIVDGRGFRTSDSTICGDISVPGPGGFPGATTSAGDGNGPGGGKGNSKGGGGGGHAGAGGYGSGSGTGGGAGGPIDFPTVLAPIHGGSGGGSGGSMSIGGGGGGAVHLVANTSITIGGGGTAGGVNVGGCGGGYGIMYNGGSGGGAGGTILVESPSVVLLSNGVLAANGGGGGDYNSNGTGPSVGENGKLSDVAAAGVGVGSGSEYGSGGNGAAKMIYYGSQGYSGTQTGGGGGGGAGIIRVNNISGSLTPPVGAIISPTLNLMNNMSQVVSSVGAIVIQ